MKLFDQSSSRKPRSNAFDLSHERKMSLNMGDLVPILCEPVIPGDRFRLNSEVFLRLMPLVSPVMHRINVFTHFFFVPNRLIWDGFEDFITGGKDGQDTTVHPYMALQGNLAAIGKGTLADYLGYNSDGIEVMKINALPFRAYQLVYDQYYRDQTLQTEVEFDKGSGLVDDEDKLYTLRKRCWEKDYFTSALPWTQRGGDVMLPFLQNSDVTLKDGLLGPALLRDYVDGSLVEVPGQLYNSGSAGEFEGPSSHKMVLDPNGSLEVDLSGSAPASINVLRMAVKLQQWLERNAIGGARYIEQILSHFGVKVPDYRLQRAEYLGGGKSPVLISEVLQTSQSEDTPQGNLAGHGISASNVHGFSRMFPEHGYVIGMLSILPKTSYQQGVRRFFMQSDKFDYPFPEFAQLGEQPVYVKELYNTEAEPEEGEDYAVFGYQSRYADYKYIPSSVHGDMKGDLEFWHMGRKFAETPSLNDEFVESDPTHRVFAVTDPAEHKIVAQIFHNLQAIRPLPFYNVPSL